MKKKGSVLDILPIILIGGMLSIGLLLSHASLGELREANNATGTPQINESYLDQAEQALGIFDAGYILVIGALFVTTIILAFYIPSHPVFFIVSLFALAISIWVSAEFSNLFWRAANTAALSDSANFFSTIVLYMKNQPLIIGVFGFLLIIVMYAKTGSNQEAVA